jgi:hypothetical protein
MFGDFEFFMFGGFELIPKQKPFCPLMFKDIPRGIPINPLGVNLIPNIKKIQNI